MDDPVAVRDPEVVLGIALEGSADFFLGRPFDENPYARCYEPAWSSWRKGWLEASWFSEMRSDEDIARWWTS